MRQIGDRLVPVGVTSGRVHTISPEESQSEGNEGGGSRRSRRRHQQNQEFNQMLGGLAGQDLEEVSHLLSCPPLLDHCLTFTETADDHGSNAPLALGPRGATTSRGAESKWE